ncbi:glycoside hydrolase family 3 C-terminal domain-containing protein [Bacteroides oleiciplenus]|uniref:Beta-glucosidase n=1 Tax=Bacteroides oleiciplenus TaxID=626931 RepID=A0A3E5BPU2_9BACE|nr:glycoside hydrolase family 3 C-terminal domain-containing protein [Bacteroides oleiciplenus]RGN39405.1 beta-glucosidase [Bacteroides oleiciplenus]
MRTLKKIVFTGLLALMACATRTAQAQELYKNENAPTHERIMDLLSRLTVEEKISLLRATSPGISRLDIPKYYHGNEALHGVVRPGRFTVFPQAIGLAATWNPVLQEQVATVISDEARARWNELDQGREQKSQFSDLLTFWSPTVNMARDPRWGRTPETYGEDPYLSGIMGTAFVKGLQGNDSRYLKIVSTPKHFAANNEEHNRFVCNPQISEKQLREYYLPAFEACVKDGKSASIMSAYNALNDVPCTLNAWLLTKVLRNDWGFKGYVVSDCGGPSLLVNAHKYVKTKEAAATLSIKAGLDLECGDDVYDEPLLSAYRQYMVTDADIDSAAYRVLRARMQLGLFDSGEKNPYTKISPAVIGSKEHQEVALNAARECIVLLKNQKKMLPLNAKKIKSIAVVGINAGSSEFGDYSGLPVIAPVSVLQGIKDRVGEDVKVVYAPWKSAVDGMELIQGASFPEGLQAEYFDNTKLQGTPKVRKEEWINFEPGNQAPDPFLPKSPLSVRWTGKLRPTVTGQYTLSFTSDDGCRLSIDGKMLIDAWPGHAVRTDTAAIYLEAGKDYQLKAEYYDNRDYAIAKLQWRVPQVGKVTRLDLYGEAGKAVRECETVVAVLGINKSIEREGQDRYDIQLPADQREFLQEIYKVNPNIVVVLVAGSSLAVNWMDEHVPAIVNAWYPGESGGKAVAEVLFGDYNPGGRLPLTYYRSLDELPPFDDYDITKGRTYKYFKGDVLYPFGYGLSYTSFKYSNLQVADGEEEVSVSFQLKNTGRYAGDEVAQVYVKLPEREEVMPVKELKGFERVSLKSGESKKVTIKLRKDLLRYWDEAKGKFIYPSGNYNIMVGASSADIRLQRAVSVLQKTKVVCVGASITAGATTANPATDAYPAQLGRMLGDDYKVINYGVSSCTMLRHGDFPYWKTKEYQKVLASNPDVVFIDLGGNDSKGINRPYMREFDKDCRDMIDAFAQLPSKPRIILLTPIVSFVKDSNGIYDEVIVKDVTPATISAAQKKNVEVINMHPVLDKHPELMKDGIHPDAEGSGMMAKAMYDYLISHPEK